MSLAVNASHLVENGMVLAQLSATSGTLMLHIALGIIGTLTLIVMAGRALAAYADERFGKMFTIVGGAVLVLGFAYFPDTTASLLVGIWKSFLG